MRFSEIVNESATSDAKLFAKGLLEYAEEAITHTKQFRDEWAMAFHFALVDAAEAIEENDFLKAEKHLNKAIGGDSHTKEEILSYFESEYGEEGLAAAERFLKGVRLDEITKADFVGGLKDPAVQELKKANREIKRLANIAGLSYSLKTHDVDGSTRRVAFVIWDMRYVPEKAHLYPNNLERDIASHYKHNLKNWTLKGYSVQRGLIEVELREV